jgi:long-chain acyl-CoA synthetase
VSQALVVGDRRRFISALLVPDRDVLVRLCGELGVAASPIEEAVADPRVVAVYERAVREALRDFAPFEQVKRFTLLPREFTIEAGELTPTLKVRRREVEARYREQIEAMYAAAGPEAA